MLVELFKANKKCQGVLVNKMSRDFPILDPVIPVSKAYLAAYGLDLLSKPIASTFTKYIGIGFPPKVIVRRIRFKATELKAIGFLVEDATVGIRIDRIFKIKVDRYRQDGWGEALLFNRGAGLIFEFTVILPVNRRAACDKITAGKKLVPFR